MSQTEHPAAHPSTSSAPAVAQRAFRAPLALWRIVRLAVHVVYGLYLIRRHFGKAEAAEKNAIIQRWAQGVMGIVGMRLAVQGVQGVQDIQGVQGTQAAQCTQAARGTLIAANHISWLDIVVLLSVSPARFVAKSEIRAWPVLGLLVAQSGTLFIERQRARDAQRLVSVMTKALQRGETLAVFPEGTTSDGTGLLPFHANLLQSAIQAAAPVQSLVLRYVDVGTNALSTTVPYTDVTLMQSVWRTLCAVPTRVDVRWGAAFDSTYFSSRKTLTLKIEQDMRDLLAKPVAVGFPPPQE